MEARFVVVGFKDALVVVVVVSVMLVAREVMMNEKVECDELLETKLASVNHFLPVTPLHQEASLSKWSPTAYNPGNVTKRCQTGRQHQASFVKVAANGLQSRERHQALSNWSPTPSVVCRSGRQRLTFQGVDPSKEHRTQVPAHRSSKFRHVSPQVRRSLPS